MVNDYVNGAFELVGGFLCWFNVRKLYQDKTVKGVCWQVQAFFATWGMWNLWYYPSLGQWASFWGGVFLVIGNTAWVLMAMWYGKIVPALSEACDRFEHE